MDDRNMESWFYVVWANGYMVEILLHTRESRWHKVKSNLSPQSTVSSETGLLDSIIKFVVNVLQMVKSA